MLTRHYSVRDDRIEKHLLVLAERIDEPFLRSVKRLLAFFYICLRDAAEEHEALIVSVPV